MEWETILVSAGASTVISTVVSLVAVPRTVAATERAKRRDLARVQLREAVQPWQSHLSRYRYRADGPPERRSDQYHSDDLTAVQTVFSIAQDLPWWQRWLISRRLRGIFGHGWVQLARDYPTEPTDQGTFGAMIAGQVMGTLELGDLRTGNLVQAYYSGDRHSPQGAMLAGRLRRLAAGR